MPTRLALKKFSRMYYIQKMRMTSTIIKDNISIKLHTHTYPKPNNRKIFVKMIEPSHDLSIVNSNPEHK